MAFHSAASNLVTGDTNGYIDCFVKDNATGATIRVGLVTFDKVRDLKANEILKTVDERLYSAKARGRNMIVDSAHA